MKTTSQLIIDLNAIGSNIELLRTKLGRNKRLMVMIKALGYGTDSVYLAPYLKQFGVDILGVAYPKEGIALRDAGIKQDIFVFNSTHYDIDDILKYDFEVAVCNKAFLNDISETADKKRKIVKVHLHVDTGMSRFGSKTEEASHLAKLASCLPGIELVGIMTHFACAENPTEDSFTQLQMDRFRQTLNSITREGIDIPWRHSANSAAAIRFDIPECNLVRLGIAIYGISSLQSGMDSLPLKPAMTLQSVISGINVCRKSDTVSYGRNYQVKREYERIAILPIGYHDGLHRRYSGKGDVLICGTLAPMVGTICMDHMMVDITDIPEAKIGDPATIFGYDHYGNYLPPELLARQGGTIPHELIACLGPRIDRSYTPVKTEAPPGTETIEIPLELLRSKVTS